MDFGKEFEKYAVKHRGLSSNTLHGYMNHNIPTSCRLHHTRWRGGRCY